MIIQENYKENFVRTYSDAGMRIMQVETGKTYSEAIDRAGNGYTYIETDIPIEEEINEDSQEA